MIMWKIFCWLKVDIFPSMTLQHSRPVIIMKRIWGGGRCGKFNIICSWLADWRLERHNCSFNFTQLIACSSLRSSSLHQVKTMVGVERGEERVKLIITLYYWVVPYLYNMRQYETVMPSNVVFLSDCQPSIPPARLLRLPVISNPL